MSSAYLHLAAQQQSSVAVYRWFVLLWVSTAVIDRAACMLSAVYLSSFHQLPPAHRINAGAALTHPAVRLLASLGSGARCPSDCHWDLMLVSSIGQASWARFVYLRLKVLP